MINKQTVICSSVVHVMAVGRRTRAEERGLGL